MRKYFLHNGNEQKGPFTIDELKNKNITRQTSIWYDGIAEWTIAGNIEELSLLFKTLLPEFKPSGNVMPTAQSLVNEAPKRKGKTSLKFVGVLAHGLLY